MNTATNKPATWFWIVSTIALVWNLMGVMAYITQVTMSPETLQAMPEPKRALYVSIPMWATGAFAFAVWGGAAGCVLLLLRKKTGNRIVDPVICRNFSSTLPLLLHQQFDRSIRTRWYDHADHGYHAWCFPNLVLPQGSSQRLAEIKEVTPISIRCE